MRNKGTKYNPCQNGRAEEKGEAADIEILKDIYNIGLH